MWFKNRREAGEKLADKLAKYAGKDVVIYALPRGGMILGYEIAKELGAPLDLIITRKIGHPSNEEYAVCAVAEDGDMICNEVERAALDKKWLAAAVGREQKEAARRRTAYVGGRKPVSAEGKVAIIVDDGIATGLTMRLAILEVKHMNPEKIVVAIPVVPPDTAQKIKKGADELVALDIPDFYLGAVGSYYEEFPQVTDEEVKRLLVRR